MALVTFVQATSAKSDTTNQVVNMSLPVITAGDMMIAAVYTSAPTTTPATGPAGWTMAGHYSPGDASGSMTILTKLMATGDATTATFTAGGVKVGVVVSRYTNASQILRNLVFVSATGGATGATLPAPVEKDLNAREFEAFGSNQGLGWLAQSGQAARTGSGTSQGNASVSTFDAPILATNTTHSANVSTGFTSGYIAVSFVVPPQVFHVSTSTLRQQGGATVAVSAPASMAAGNLLIGVVSTNIASAVITPPAGWTLESAYPNPASPPGNVFIYTKVSTASEPTAYTWGQSGGSTAFTLVGISQYSGCAGIRPASPLWAGNATATPGATLAAMTPNPITDRRFMVISTYQGLDVIAPAGTNTRALLGYISAPTPCLYTYDYPYFATQKNGPLAYTTNWTSPWITSEFFLVEGLPGTITAATRVLDFWNGSTVTRRTHEQWNGTALTTRKFDK